MFIPNLLLTLSLLSYEKTDSQQLSIGGSSPTQLVVSCAGDGWRAPPWPSWSHLKGAARSIDGGPGGMEPGACRHCSHPRLRLPRFAPPPAPQTPTWYPPSLDPFTASLIAALFAGADGAGRVFRRGRRRGLLPHHLPRLPRGVLRRRCRARSGIAAR